MWPMVSLQRPGRATSAAIVDRTADSAILKRAASCGGSQSEPVQWRRRPCEPKSADASPRAS